MCLSLQTQALCSKLREGHVPSLSQFQSSVHVNTVWKCSHTWAECDEGFFGLIKEKLSKWSLCWSSTHMIQELHGSQRTWTDVTQDHNKEKRSGKTSPLLPQLIKTWLWYLNLSYPVQWQKCTHSSRFLLKPKSPTLSRVINYMLLNCKLENKEDREMALSLECWNKQLLPSG